MSRFQTTDLNQYDIGIAPPDRTDDDTIQFYDKYTSELKRTTAHKIKALLEYDCFRYIGNNTFLSLPLNTSEFVFHDGRFLTKIPYTKDYNRDNIPYILRKFPVLDPNGQPMRNEKGRAMWGFCCSCQGWLMASKYGKLNEYGINCAHILGLIGAFKEKRFAR
jgi:hypothetical protein